MQNAFYSVISIMGIIVHLIINFEFFFRSDSVVQKSHKTYRRFLLSVLAYYIVDMCWGIFSAIGNIQFLYIDTCVYYLILTISIICWFKYIAEYLQFGELANKLINILGVFFVVVEVTLLTANYFLRVLFTFTSDGTYQGFLGRYIFLGIQFLLYLVIAVYSNMVANENRGKYRQRYFAISVYGYETVVALLLQTLFPELPVYSMGLMIGISILHIFVHEDEKFDFKEELGNKQKSLEARYNIIQSMSTIYFASYYIDIVHDTFVELSSIDTIRKSVDGAETTHNNQECLYKACDELVTPEFRDVMREFYDMSTIEERLKDTNVISCEYIGVTTGWSAAYLIAGDRDGAGNLQHIFLACRTIHEEKKREHEHIRSLKDINDIIATAGLGVWHIYIKDGMPSRMQINDKMRELLAIKEKNLSEEEIYHRWFDNIVPSALHSVERSVKEMIEGGFSENTYVWNHPEKGEIYVRCGGTAEQLDDGTFVLSGYHSDVTEIVTNEEKQKADLAKAKQAAEAANNAKTQFLFNMSHDIRTPMNAIVGFTILLEKNLADEKRARDYLNKIKNSSEYLLKLINNDLEMARIESGAISLDETLLEIGKVANDIRTVFAEQFASKNISFEFNCNTQSKYIYADQLKINEILMNLLSNAYKFTPSGGTIKLSIVEHEAEKDGYAAFEIKISDNGIGMSQEYLPHVFEVFSRERTSTETRQEGSGLGMAIVKKLLDMQGGTIEVESALGKGTTFTIHISCRIGSEEEMTLESIKHMDYSLLKDKKIIVAEDNDLNAEIVEEMLGEVRAKVFRAVDGTQCIDMIQKAEPGTYDLILMDVQMPNLDGYRATQIIRLMKEPEKSNIPIIAMTANAFEEDKRDAAKAGMNAHLAKPIKLEDLVACISRVLDN